jgi:hypothetical protein
MMARHAMLQEKAMEHDILKTLRDHFQTGEPKKEKRVCIDAPKNQVYYRLIVIGGAYYLEFWIDSCANHRNDFQRMLHDLFASPEMQREYSFLSYYNARGVRCRRPSLTLADLETDAAEMRKRLASIEKAVRDSSGPGASNPSVGIKESNVAELLGMRLKIPDYQRAYCWGKENILGLLEDLYQWQQRHGGERIPYRLGTVILKEQDNGTYDVIDGQQRLITLALIAVHLNLGPKADKSKPDIALGSNNSTKKALDAIQNARTIIGEWFRKHQKHSDDSTEEKQILDLETATVGVVVIGRNESEDLSFTFFNHLNSAGVLLTDYELLKGHHLRFVKESGTAEIMARRWHELENGKIDGEQWRLLHLCLFRIRKWLANEGFSANADRLETHDLFKEFTLGFEPLEELCTSYKPVEIESLLSGGIEFFEYVDRFRRLFESFWEQPAVKAIAPLRSYSYGTLYEGILALAFMFFCKFGDIYLKEATYAIAWLVSKIRNEGQVRRDVIGKRDEFRMIAKTIARATHESEVLGRILNRLDTYAVANLGPTAKRYWVGLRNVAGELLGKDMNSVLVKEQLNFIEPLMQAIE